MLSDVVHSVGYQENPYIYMNQCDCLVLLSSYEGTPVTIYEALVLGKGIIARNVGGVAEQLNNGEYGILLDNTLNE